MQDSDIKTLINGIQFKVKVVCIVKTKHGFLFEKSDYDYIFVIGGKVSINETLEETVRREMKEELGMNVKNVDLCAVIENLYSRGSQKVHEMNFVYMVHDIFTGPIPKGFLEVSSEDLGTFNIRPGSIVDILKDNEGQLQYIIVNEWRV